MSSLSERIENAYDVAVEAKRTMQVEQSIMADEEQSAKMDNLDEWTAAKNNDVRRSIIERELGEPGGVDGAPSLYWTARRAYIGARDRYRLALLEIERLRLLVEAAKAGGGAV